MSEAYTVLSNILPARSSLASFPCRPSQEKGAPGNTITFKQITSRSIAMPLVSLVPLAIKSEAQKGWVRGCLFVVTQLQLRFLLHGDNIVILVDGLDCQESVYISPC